LVAAIGTDSSIERLQSALHQLRPKAIQPQAGSNRRFWPRNAQQKDLTASLPAEGTQAGKSAVLFFCFFSFARAKKKKEEKTEYQVHEGKRR